MVWASSPAFKVRAEAAIEAALRRPRDAKKTAADVIEMRELMERERPGKGDWDLKLDPGGLVDIEFAAQFLQLATPPRTVPFARIPARPWRLAGGGLAR